MALPRGAVRVGLQCAIVVYPSHTHLLFSVLKYCFYWQIVQKNSVQKFCGTGL